jgi:hypothetical protein
MVLHNGIGQSIEVEKIQKSFSHISADGDIPDVNSDDRCITLPSENSIQHFSRRTVSRQDFQRNAKPEMRQRVLNGRSGLNDNLLPGSLD